MSRTLSELLDLRLEVVADMNMDGVITISDVFLWLEWLYFLPGDLAALAILGTPVGDFFEVTPWSMQGLGTGVLSLFVWFVVFEASFGRIKS